MKAFPLLRGFSRRQTGSFVAAAVFGGGIILSSAQETVPAEDPALPKALAPTHFEAVLGNSPFLRTLSLTETYALRGIAEINGEQVATLYNRETEKSLLVSARQDNEEQMKLLAINGSPDAASLKGMGNVSATIAVGGEEVELKFEPQRVSPSPKGGGKGSSSGGKPEDGKKEERKGPSQEDMDRYKSLSKEQQEKFRNYMRQTMQKYPDMSREERGNMIRGALTRLSDGRDINVDSGGGGDNGGGGDSRR